MKYILLLLVTGFSGLVSAQDWQSKIDWDNKTPVSQGEYTFSKHLSKENLDYLRMEGLSIKDAISYIDTQIRKYSRKIDEIDEKQKEFLVRWKELDSVLKKNEKDMTLEEIGKIQALNNEEEEFAGWKVNTYMKYISVLGLLKSKLEKINPESDLEQVGVEQN